MKINKQFQLIFIVAFFIPLIRQIGNAVLENFRPFIVGIENLHFVLLIDYLKIVISLIIVPILIFALFYYIGKKPYITFEMRPILLALIIGNVASLFVGSIVYTAISGITAYYIQILVMILEFTLNYFVVDFLAALAGLSIRYIRKKSST
jgi:hypothetical protein